MTTDSVTDFSYLIKECEKLIEIALDVRATLNTLLVNYQYSEKELSRSHYRCLNIMDRLLDNLDKGMGTFLESMKRTWNRHLLETLS